MAELASTNVTAIRNVIDYVLRWLTRLLELASTKGANRTELGTVFSRQLFELKGFMHPIHAAPNLVDLVA